MWQVSFQAFIIIDVNFTIFFVKMHILMSEQEVGILG